MNIHNQVLGAWEQAPPAVTNGEGNPLLFEAIPLNCHTDQLRAERSLWASSSHLESFPTQNEVYAPRPDISMILWRRFNQAEN